MSDELSKIKYWRNQKNQKLEFKLLNEKLFFN